MLGSSAILADDGGGGVAVAAAAAATATAAAARAGRVEAGLPRGAAAELRLHGLIERSVPLVVPLFLRLFVLSASASADGSAVRSTITLQPIVLDSILIF